MASQEDHVLHRDDEEARDVYALDEWTCRVFVPPQVLV